MLYYFFLDETGDHGLSFIDENFPVFLLCGCLIRGDILRTLEMRLDSLKLKFFGSEAVILHSRDIRKCEGAFQVLFDLDKKKVFYDELNLTLGSSEHTIIGAGINKKDYIIRYGKGAKDPYALSLSFILERLVFCLDGLDRNSNVKIKVEKRGKKEDRQLLAHYNSVIDTGTYYISSDRFAKRIKEFKFHAKRENIAGLQVADLCAYPLARFIINPTESYIPFSIIKDKIYSNKDGEFGGWGLKIFP